MVRRISYGIRFDQAVADGTLTNILAANHGRQSVLQLLGDRVDLIIHNTYGAHHIMTEMGVADRVAILSPPIQILKTYLGFSKKRNLLALRDSFDRTIRAMREDGTYDRILSRFILVSPTTRSRH